MHHTDSGVERVERALELDRLAVQLYLAAVAPGLRNDRHTEEYAHQRRLAGAVLADQAYDLARFDVERHVLEYGIAVKIL